MRKNYGSSLEVKLYLLVEAVFQVQLWRLGLHWLQLDGHVLVVVEVFAQSQLAEVAAADFLAHPEVGPDHQHGRRPRGRSRLSHVVARSRRRLTDPTVGFLMAVLTG